MRSKNIYRFRFNAICPVDTSVIDGYDALITSRDVIPVEKILEAVELLTKAPVFQEHITIKLALSLRAKVETVGTHSGVLVKAIAKWK